LQRGRGGVRASWVDHVREGKREKERGVGRGGGVPLGFWQYYGMARERVKNERGHKSPAIREEKGAKREWEGEGEVFLLPRVCSKRERKEGKGE
jgi:hypothetical protein